MIVRFSTQFGQLTMLGEVAVALLKGMGHSGTVPGAILAADLPGALASFHRMLEVSGATTGMTHPAEAADEDEDEREREPVVTLRMRAVPLIEMIQTAIARESDLMWERA